MKSHALSKSDGNILRHSADEDFERKFNDSCRRFSEMTLKYERKSEKQKKVIEQLRQQNCDAAEQIDFLLDQIEQLKREAAGREK